MKVMGSNPGYLLKIFSTLIYCSKTEILSFELLPFNYEFYLFSGLSPSNLVDLKFVVCGAGSAAAGVMLTIRNGKFTKIH